MMRQRHLRASMELFIETLTGSSMTLRVSPSDTIKDIKDYIHKLEGIPTSQQHLVWQTTELEDDRSLQDCQVYSGATLRLVLNMRGGPVNTRRVPSEDPTPHEMAEYISEVSRSDLLSPSSSRHRPVTVFVCHSGDQLNFYRILTPGSVSPTLPCSRSSSEDSTDEDEMASSPVRERQEENNRTRDKMKAVRSLMETRSHMKGAREKAPSVPAATAVLMPKPPSACRPTTCNRLRRLSSGKARFTELNRKPCLPPVGSQSSEQQPVETVLSLNPEMSAQSAGIVSEENSSDGFISEPTTHVVQLDEVFESQSTIVESHQPFEVIDNVVGAAARDESENFRASEGCVRDEERGATAVVSSLCITPQKSVSFASSSEAPRVKSRSASGPRKDPVGRVPRASLPTSYFSRSSPEPFSDAGAKFASAVAAALSNATTTSAAAPRTMKMSGVRGGGSVVLRSLNTHEMRAMSGIISTIVHGHRSAKSSRSGSGTAVGQGSGSSGTTAVRSVKAPCKMLVDYGLPETPAMSAPHKLPPLADQEPAEPSGSLPVPAVEPSPPAATKTPTKRCATCGKKTRLATSFQCRCGGNFCSLHRYAEVHACTFDYKLDGRRFLEQSNPLVTAPKLPKI